MSSYRWNRNFVNGRDQNDWMGPPPMVMDPPSLFPSTLTRPVEMDGCVSTDGARSRTWSLSVTWSMDSPIPTGGTTRAIRLPLAVVTVVSLSSTTTTGTWM